MTQNSPGTHKSYAVPTKTHRQLHKSRPPVAWEGVRDALEEAPLCLQPDKGSEDCLYLNVFVPEEAAAAANASGELLPVLAWIPGGAYQHGGASLAGFGPDFFLDRGIVVVTMNYRLSALGFLSLEDEVVPGNAGLKDQVMALEWVQKNIAAFGGDPSKVTIGGESAGGCSTSHHLLSSRSAGLFRGVISQNGQAVAPWGIAPRPREMALRLAALLGAPTQDSEQLVAFLRQQDAQLFINRDDELLTDEEKFKINHLPFSPVIEPEVEDAIVTEHPIKVLKEGRFNRVPVLTGGTSGEGVGFVVDGGYLNDTEKLQTFNDNFELAVAPLVHLQTEDERINATWKLHDFYFGQGDITFDDAQSFVNLVTDLSFSEPTDSLVRYVSQLSDQPVYYYEFDYRGEVLGNTTYGTPHAGEIGFLFLVEHIPVAWDPTTVEGALRQRLVDSWSNFVKHGNPNSGNDSVLWEPFTMSSPNFLHITTEYSLEQNKDKERMDFWHENIPM
ncbi:cholinesterase 1-like [Schistocerca serialis cubense]|uniref:cholinesterase 1-like n=1 Tax=Schistocerca serialis cubense TaxID=2023355 RepID=UPI00214E78A0|nr:cholinesterase 1-like [Schistocerca serialis cubense]